jgi:hypothetical protein
MKSASASATQANRGVKLKIPVRRLEIPSANILEIEAGTDGPQGGDSGHGGRTYLRLTNGGATAWKVIVTDETGRAQHTEVPKDIEIILGGDTELDTFIEGLKFAVGTLEQLRKGQQAEKHFKEIDLS